jgi:hypothetical protein
MSPGRIPSSDGQPCLRRSLVTAQVEVWDLPEKA